MTQLVQPPAPRVRLPWDAILLVWKEADASTLAVLGRVSFDVLVSTAPLLYRDVEVKSIKALEGLFCEREEEKRSTTSRINPYLSLHQVRTLFVNLCNLPPSSSPSSTSRSLHLSHERLLPGPLLLDLLRISFSSQDVLSSVQPLLLFVNPIIVENESCSEEARKGGYNSWLELPRIPPLNHWSRLEVVELKSSLIYMITERDSYSFACLPPSSLDRRRVLRFHPTLRSLLSLVILLGQFSLVIGMSGMQDGSMVLVVGSQEEKERAEEAIRKEGMEWKSKFAVELETLH